MSFYIDEYGDVYRNGRYAPEVIVPDAAELAEDDAEAARWRAQDPRHHFTLPCGPEDFAAGITPSDDHDRPF